MSGGGPYELRVKNLALSIFISIVGLVCGGVAIVLDFSLGKPLLVVSVALLVASFWAGDFLDQYQGFFFRKKKRERKS